MNRRESRHVDSAAQVGKRLREARERAGLSQRALSFPGCTPAYISRIEAGERVPSLQLLRELADRLRVSEQYLAWGEGAQTEHASEDELVEAEVALRLDDLELAERLYVYALKDAATAEEQARALTGLGQLAFRRGDVHEAISQLEAALERSSDADTASLAETLGRAYATVGEPESAIAVFERHLERAEARDDLLETVRFQVLLSNALIDVDNFARAEELLGRALARAGDSQDPLLRARLYWSQSRLHAHQGDAEPAARYAHLALQLLELTEHDYYTACAHQMLAFIELNRGQPEEALQLLRRGRELLKDSGGKTEIAKFRLEEARALAQLGRLEEAASMAMGLAQDFADGDPVEAGRSYALLAQTFRDAGDRERALELYELAVEMLEPHAPLYLVDVYAQLAELLESIGRKEDALDVLKRAVRVRHASIRRSA